jgi:predicted RNA-binding Zn-ribbon protein involved in translation (DUF1610 family)
MDNFINLTCPTCGGKLQRTDDIERFACGHCRNDYIIKGGRGIVSRAPVTESLNNVKVDDAKAVSELSIKRLNDEIKELWGKGINVRKHMNEIDKPMGFYAPLYLALQRVEMAKGLHVVPYYSNHEKQKDAYYSWFATSDLQLSMKELKILRDHILKENNEELPSDDINELFTIEETIKKKEEEIKKHQEIVGI